jgi:hypothetical protein
MRPRCGGLQGLGATVDIDLVSAAQAGDGAVLDDLGDLADRLEVAVRGDREAGLDDVDPHLLEDLGEFQLLVVRHRGAGRLLAVAHGGVENDDVVALVESGGSISEVMELLVGRCLRGGGGGF